VPKALEFLNLEFCILNLALCLRFPLLPIR
jgi:hypothetical protein